MIRYRPKHRKGSVTSRSVSDLSRATLIQIMNSESESDPSVSELKAESSERIWTLVDQVVASGSNFLMGAVVARTVGASQFATFGIVVSMWIFASGVHRAVAVEGTMVLRRGLDDDRLLVRVGAEAVLAISLAAGALAVLISITAITARARSFGLAALSLGVFIFPILLQDYWRFAAFARHRAIDALKNDLLFLVVQASALAIAIGLGWKTSWIAVTSWGLGGTAAAIYGMRQFRMAPRPSHAFESFRALWGRGRWLTIDFLASYGPAQIFFVVAVSALGAERAGGLRAAIAFLGPSQIIFFASYGFAFSRASRAFHDRSTRAMFGFLFRVAFVGAAPLLAYAATLVALGSRIIGLVYGSEFQNLGAIAAVFAVQLTIDFVGVMLVIGLKILGQTRRVLPTRLVCLLLGCPLTFAMSHRYGVVGAALAGAVWSFGNLAGTVRIVRRFVAENRVTAQRNERVPAPAGGIR